MSEVVYIGLNQMPTDGVERALKACRETPEKILVDGNVVVEGRY